MSITNVRNFFQSKVCTVHTEQLHDTVITKLRMVKSSLRDPSECALLYSDTQGRPSVLKLVSRTVTRPAVMHTASCLLFWIWITKFSFERQKKHKQVLTE